jgi:hypothetical protein
MAYLLIGWLVIAIAFALFGAWIAKEKHRAASIGALIGFVFGPLGVLVLALLTDREPEPSYRKLRSYPAMEDGNWEVTSPRPLPPTKSLHSDEDEDRALGFLTGK